MDGVKTFKYRQSSSTSLTPLVAPVYELGWGQAGPQSTACSNCQPLWGLGGLKRPSLGRWHRVRDTQKYVNMLRHSFHRNAPRPVSRLRVVVQVNFESLHLPVSGRQTVTSLSKFLESDRSLPCRSSRQPLSTPGKGSLDVVSLKASTPYSSSERYLLRAVHAPRMEQPSISHANFCHWF